MSRRGTYPSGKAGLTITDDATRRSIAAGTTSPTYFDSGGNEHYRGVVQADYVLGNNLSYLDGVYTSPNNGSRSSHTGGAMAGTMYVTPTQNAGSVAHTVKQKLGLVGMIGLVIAGFIGFMLIERR